MIRVGQFYLRFTKNRVAKITKVINNQFGNFEPEMIIYDLYELNRRKMVLIENNCELTFYDFLDIYPTNYYTNHTAGSIRIDEL